jgi:small subunit ribosomal protein S1
MMIRKEDARGNEELAKLYEENISEVKEGEILKGKVVQVTDKDVLIDIGYKSEGMIHRSELTDPDDIKIGDQIDVILESKENDMGMVVLSHEKAKKFKGWQNIMDNYKEGDIIEGKVFKKVRGGFMVDVGMEAFLPASLSMMQEFGGDNILGQKLVFKIVKINIPRKNIVLSRKEIVDEKRREEKQAILGELNKGDIVKGVVRNITDFGAFIDIGGGITGLLHITDMSWGRVGHPSDVVKVGDEVEVVVLDFDKTSVKVSLGIKQKTQNPWDDIADKYPEGAVVKGRVVNIMPYGVFVEIEKGIEGLIHISEFAWTKKFGHPSEMFKPGDEVEAMVLKTDREAQKLSLGIKQLEKDPWEGVEERFNVGDKVKGQINAITDYGAFVELEKGVEGLVHVSDLSWTKRVTHPKDVLTKGEEIETMILNVDEQNRRIALGVKQLADDPWDEIIQKYKTDTEWEGKVTNITNFGIFIELEADLEGLLHVSEAEAAPDSRIEETYKVGDIVKVKILHIDGIQKKIALSNKGMELPEREAAEPAPKSDQSAEETGAEENENAEGASEEAEKAQPSEEPAGAAEPSIEDEKASQTADETGAKENESADDASEDTEVSAPEEEVKESAPEEEAKE